MSKYEKAPAPDLIRAASLDRLLDLWELTTAQQGNESATVRGWLMDEIEKRSPDGFNAWLDLDAPEDNDLRQYVTVKSFCLQCSHFTPGGSTFGRDCPGTSAEHLTGCAARSEK